MDDRGFILDSHATAQDVYSILHGNEIRTLLLAPGGKNTPIVCELQVVPSPSSTQFEALSYVWGGTTQTHAISCNGFDFAVTQSLYNALSHLRYTDSWRRIWVDQLCINQIEDQELMKQVSMMGTLYSSACRVVVWLGKSDKTMSCAFNLVQNTSLSASLVRSDFLQSSPSPATPRRKSLPPRNSPRSAVYSGRYSRGSSSRESLPSLSSSTSSLSSLASSTSSRPKNRRRDTPPSLKHALSIFQHVYFMRKWTFQEIILAKAAIICCGDLEMAWNDLSTWYFHYASKLRSSSLLYDSDGSFENILTVRNELDKGTLALSHLLMLTRPRLSTKPEDAVYAILGLVPDLVPSLNRTFKVTEDSKDESLFRLYLQVFQHCIEKENDLAILSAAGRYKGNDQAQDWPSWLPDWRQKLPLRPLVLSNLASPGPQSAFDDITDTTSLLHRRDNRPLYRLHFDPAMLPLSSRRFSMTVTGVRLGCIVIRPLSWPGSFLVADPQIPYTVASNHSSTGEDKYSLPLSSLIPSLTAFMQQSQTSLDAGIATSYSTKLIQSSLEAEVKCRTVRTSATVETGDWLCAFRGGRTLYAIRPLQDAEMSPQLGNKAENKLKSGGSAVVAEVPRRAIKCIYLGECSAHGPNPEILRENASHSMELELG